MGLLKNAVFSDMTSAFLVPSEPEKNSTVTVRIRVGKNDVNKVVVVCGKDKIEMTAERSDEYFTYYVADIHVGETAVSYYFIIERGLDTYFYDRRGVVEKPYEPYYFCVIPGFHVPEWAKGAVMYQIFVDRFCNGDETNDVVDDEYVYLKDYVKKVSDWYQLPDKDDVRNFYGGDLQGVIDKLDYLVDLGVEAIYFNPIFVSPSNHKYDAQDYEHIDPHLGKIVEDKGECLQDGIMDNREASKYIERTTNPANLAASDALFADLVKEAHKRGIRIILDGVFNHCGSFHKWMDKERIYEQSGQEYEVGAYQEKNSPYHDYFYFRRDEWPQNDSYESWWGFETLPKLAYESTALQQNIFDIARKWVSEPYGADGWRLDVAEDLGSNIHMNHAFWRRFRDVVKSEKADALILAEHYGSAKDWLLGDQWDSVMNYDAFMEPVTWFLTGMEKHSDEFREDMLNNTEIFWSSMRTAQNHFTLPSLQTTMNELSNHDHSRFLTRTSRRIGRLMYLSGTRAEENTDKAVMREAVVIQMTWVGAPTIYYGDEAGLCGFTDPDNRRTYPWGREDKQMIAFHKDIIRIHKDNQEFKTGSIKQVTCINGILGYGRFLPQEQSLVLINNNDRDMNIEVNTWEIGIPSEALLERLIATDKAGYTTESEYYEVEQGKLEILLHAKSAMVLKRR